MDKVDTVVIGAGVVGLAIARTHARAGREVLILEAAEAFGTGISARNSEVIHAGLYYPPGSLKARLCARGRTLLYAYCAERGIDHRRCGKLIVATHPDQHATLDCIAESARRNGVTTLRHVSAQEACTIEPALQCTAALLSPDTGIIDSHGLMLSLLGDAEQAGATLVVRTPVLGGQIDAEGWTLHTPELSFKARQVINCAGLGAQSLAHRFQGLAAQHIPPLHLAKGDYFSLQGRSPFSHLIYPAPEKHGLGIHLTLDLAGQARFGPDVSWIEKEDYTVDAQKAAIFATAIRRYWPDLPDNALQPAYAGIRPKPHAPGAASCDFMLSTEAEHGLPGLTNLFGIESPGLTASLALAEYLTQHLHSE